MSTADLPKTLGHLHSNGEFCLHYSPTTKEWPLDVVSLEEARAYGDKRAREAAEAEYQRGYTDGLISAAFYVTDHCQQGEDHAAVIVALKHPAAAMLASPSPDMLEKR